MKSLNSKPVPLEDIFPFDKPLQFVGVAEDKIYGQYTAWITIDKNDHWLVEFSFLDGLNQKKERYSGKMSSTGGSLVSPWSHHTLTYSGFTTAICRAYLTTIISFSMENSFYLYLEDRYGYTE
ncbi:hypothetical protein [Bdellovibrio sp.]|uniref:hypothetical protein n=1 Tax=Bdellovibrio sp. TaxID=28201 RepID=UPI003221D0DA